MAFRTKSDIHGKPLQMFLPELSILRKASFTTMPSSSGNSRSDLQCISDLSLKGKFVQMFIVPIKVHSILSWVFYSWNFTYACNFDQIVNVVNTIHILKIFLSQFTLLYKSPLSNNNETSSTKSCAESYKPSSHFSFIACKSMGFVTIS